MKRIYILVVALFVMFPGMLGAQALRGSYFMDNSVNRNKMNPAFAARGAYLHIPAIGNLSVGTGTNLDMPTFLFPSGNELLTFLHKDVSVEQFDKALAKYPSIDTETYANLINFGFRTKNQAYWTFDISMHAGLDIDLPRDLFMFIKQGTGTENRSWNIAGFNAYATGSVHASLGYSRPVSEGIRIGVRARFIAPVAYAALNLENVRLTTGYDKWTIETEGYLYGAMQGLDVNIPEDGTNPQVAFDMDRFLQKKALAGYGGSVDLGVDWEIIKTGFFRGLSVSAAVTNLGLISYKADALSAFSTAGKAEWGGFQDLTINQEELSQSVNELVESAKEGLLDIKRDEAPSKLIRSTMPEFYAGVKFPILWNRMNFGLLYSGRMSHSYYRQELTASYNVTPLKWLALGLNYSFLNTHSAVGCIFEITPKAGFNLCMGFDCLPGQWAPAPILEKFMDPEGTMAESGQDIFYLPTSLGLNFHFGLSLALGAKHSR